MKWLITGATGQLGLTAQNFLSNIGQDVTALDSSELDICDKERVFAVFRKARPSIVLNAAAWTHVDGAENNEVEALRVNGDGAENIALAASMTQSKLVHLSTDYVFDGSAKSPIKENSDIRPINAYGRSKADGERKVLSAYPGGTFLIRTSWMYSEYGDNFVRKIIEKSKLSSEKFSVVGDQYGQPTYALDLVKQIFLLVNSRAECGIYHGTNAGETTWYSFARRILELTGDDPDRILYVDSQTTRQSTLRPHYSVLGHNKWTESGLSIMRHWDMALQDALPSILRTIQEENSKNAF